MREYRSVRTWASQKSGRIVEDASVAVLADLLGDSWAVVDRKSVVAVCVVQGVCEGGQELAAVSPHPVKDAKALLPKRLEVNSMTRECFQGPDLDRGSLLADTGAGLR
ncbi:MAG: hypothetical protein CBD74_09355 [Saprospirales bacterium TMED214]|nr:MAG: hypothetical protein CBD74_09355 [Saprospirales bacterium TMED214]